jgi:beta-mannosidase
VEGLRVGVEMEEPWTRPKLKAGFEVVHGSEGIKAKIGLIAAGGEVVRSQEVEVRGGEGQVEWTFEDGDVELWWPHGHGKQPLYTVKVELITEVGHSFADLFPLPSPRRAVLAHIFTHPLPNQSGRTLHTTTTRIGFRTAKVVQEPLIDAPGTSFLFEINGRRIFCGGSNWIPADSFLTEVDEDRYRRWLELMVEGNQNMVRVWAGGE